MRFRRWLGGFVFGFVVARMAMATTVIPPTFNELVTRAQSIVHAEVTGIRCERTPYGSGSVIHTYVRFSVIKVLKGVANDTIELRLLGGTVGDETMAVDGMPSFVVGNRDVLFVENNGTQWCPLVGVMHGRYRLQRRATDGAEVVHRDNGVPLGDPAEVQLPMAQGAAATLFARARTSEGLTLAGFESLIQGELSRANR
jgi:hypothetical protein